MNEMYCDLQSRGIKRKFVEDDDQTDQTQHLPTSDANSDTNLSTIVTTKVQNSNTTKSSVQTTITSRILQHNLTVQHCYVRQRQQIFNISICKLNRFRQSSDPSLLRSVLVCNGLKTLERELFREGIKINFGPNGVLFTPPVLNTQNMTLDPPPNALNNTLVNNQNNNNNCNNSLNNNLSNISVNQIETKTSTADDSNYMEIGSETDVSTDNSNGEYDKYLLDLDSSSGRVTPFQKTCSSVSNSSPVYDSESALEFGSTPLSQSSNSAFWGSDEASDRLTSLNWSSVFNSSSVLTSTSGVNKTTQLSDSGQEAIAINGSDESVPNKSSNSSSFTTLLPPSASSTSSSSVMSTTTTSNSTLSLSVSSKSVSTASLSQNSISSQIVTNSHSVNPLSVINGNPISFSNNSTNDEIFGDIDLSLYDFDLLSPLSPPNVKLAPITAEELIRNISSNDSNSSSVSSSSCITITSSAISSPLSSSSTSSSSSLSSNGSSVYSNSSSSGFHGRYFKSSDKLFSDDRDQQAITPVMS